jgi:hypothetical protein
MTFFLFQTVMKNCRDRTRQRQHDPMVDSMDGQMLWALWRQIRRSNDRRRRRVMAAAESNVNCRLK